MIIIYLCREKDRLMGRCAFWKSNDINIENEELCLQPPISHSNEIAIPLYNEEYHRFLRIMMNCWSFIVRYKSSMIDILTNLKLYIQVHSNIIVVEFHQKMIIICWWNKFKWKMTVKALPFAVINIPFTRSCSSVSLQIKGF